MSDMSDLQQFDKEFQDAQDDERGSMAVIAYPIVAAALVAACICVASILQMVTA
jgi:hypothetical protein